MYSLFLKDLLIQKRMIWFIAGYSILILLAFNNPVFSAMTYVMGGMASAYILLMGACAYESKGNNESVLNSLPLRRKDVVRARYLSVLLFMFLSLAIIGGLGAIMKLLGLSFPQRYLGWFDVLAVAISLSLLSSLYLPFYFKIGYIQARIFNVLAFLLFFFGPTYVVNYYRENSEKEIIQQVTAFLAHNPDWIIYVLGFMALLILLFISYLVSVRFYQRREF